MAASGVGSVDNEQPTTSTYAYLNLNIPAGDHLSRNRSHKSSKERYLDINPGKIRLPIPSSEVRRRKPRKDRKNLRRLISTSGLCPNG